MYAIRSYYVVNKNLIEALALLLLFVLKEKGWGLYALQLFSKKKKEESDEEKSTDHARREVLKSLATLPALGVLGLGAFNETRKFGVDTLSGATIKIGGAVV